MPAFIRRGFSSITPGVRLLLGAMVLAFLTVEIAVRMGNVDLRPWLLSSGPSFWKGRFWVIVTYGLVPGGLTDLLFNGLMLGLLGSQVERAWSRAQFWIYCLATVAAGGLVKVLLQPSIPQPLSGPSALIVALLVASLPVMGNQKIQLFGLAEIPAKWGILFLAFGALLTAASGSNIVDMVIPLAGGIAGWLLIALRGTRGKYRPATATAVGPQRIRRLEL
jgi:membrane associated rhomboid family serine protease